jgi:transcriptional regulator with XRE-family HTH domain
MLIVDERSASHMEFAKRIRDVRLELGLNLSQFAAVVGVSTSTACQWESGAFAPRNAMLERISQAVPERYKADFVKYERSVRREPIIKNDSEMGSAELDLLEAEKIVFVRKLESEIGLWLKNYRSVHVQVENLAGQRFVSLSPNSPVNKGVVVFLHKDLARASRIDIHARQLRRLNVDWASLLIPFGQRWTTLKLLVARPPSL